MSEPRAIMGRMDAAAAASPLQVETPTPQVIRCARCGVSSVERTCFVIPEKNTKGPRDTRCVICEMEGNELGPVAGVFSTLGAVAVPLFLYTMLTRAVDGITLSAMFVSVLFLPVIIAAHELGHAITARACGLEVGAIMIGRGPKIWGFRVFGIPIRIHAWPLSGQVVLGTSRATLPALRARVWLTFLMGPLTNVLLIALAVAAWPWLVEVLGFQLPTVWIILNAIDFLYNIFPHYLQEAGRKIPSDGLALLRVPRFTQADLDTFLLSVPVMRARIEFEDEQFEAARATALIGLQHSPANAELLVMKSACDSRLGNYDEALAILRPMLDAPEHSNPWMRATIRNNLAVTSFLAADANTRGDIMEEADRLSALAYESYPCILAFRSSRALILTGCGKPEQALSLLEYRHYESATRSEGSFRHIARAYALRALGRADESRTETERAVSLQPKVIELLPRLGMQI